jgi:hypothetical protein
MTRVSPVQHGPGRRRIAAGRCVIGEALAVLWSQVDLETGKVKITHTIVRVKGEGLLRNITKSKAGQRELGLPNWVLAVLRPRFAAGIRLDEPIFADALGGFRDPPTYAAPYVKRWPPAAACCPCRPERSAIFRAAAARRTACRAACPAVGRR